jgi:hypothetical protein
MDRSASESWATGSASGFGSLSHLDEHRSDCRIHALGPAEGPSEPALCIDNLAVMDPPRLRQDQTKDDDHLSQRGRSIVARMRLFLAMSSQ